MSKQELIKELVKYPHFSNWGETFRKYPKNKLQSILAVAQNQNHLEYNLDTNSTEYIAYFS